MSLSFIFAEKQPKSITMHGATILLYDTNGNSYGLYVSVVATIVGQWTHESLRGRPKLGEKDRRNVHSRGL